MTASLIAKDSQTTLPVTIDDLDINNVVVDQYYNEVVSICNYSYLGKEAQLPELEYVNLLLMQHLPAIDRLISQYDGSLTQLSSEVFKNYIVVIEDNTFSIKHNIRMILAVLMMLHLKGKYDVTFDNFYMWQVCSFLTENKLCPPSATAVFLKYIQNVANGYLGAIS